MLYRIVFVCCLVGITAGCYGVRQHLLLGQVERKILYHPSEFPVELTERDLPFEDVHFESADGTQLHGWFVDHPDPVGIALFCHGNAGNIVSRGESMMILNQRHRLAIMMFDYRGYGRSEGSPTESGILADARAARAWLAERKGVAEQEIIVMGRSLGGAVAVDLAATDGARALVLASTFASLPKVAGDLVPVLPTSILMTQRFNSIDKIHNYSGPLLQSHGDADRLIDIEQARELFKAAPSKNKQFVVIPDAGHNSPQSEEYRVAFEQFLQRLPR